MLLLTSPAAATTSVVFIGNSFTHGDAAGTPPPSVTGYAPSTVTDLNRTGRGGIPAIFKGFTTQLGLDYAVSLRTTGGYTLLDHYNQGRRLFDKPWDVVVLQSHSVLDRAMPGNPAQLIEATGLLGDMFYAKNPDVDIYLTATWSRADLTYRNTSSPWFGKPIDAMAKDIQSGYEQAAAASPHVTDVIEVGAAWNDAMVSGLADPNPFDRIATGPVNLWARDSYHASLHGSYLSALMQFGAITRVDPRLLGASEAAATFFGFLPEHTTQLQNIAYERLREGEFLTVVPEPSSWAMLICGFGAVGTTLRRRRAQALPTRAEARADRSPQGGVGLI